jgi:nucleoside-diphosphate-sugar epimerase
VLVTGGAGYVGSALVPALLGAGYEVRVLDLYLYGRDVLDAVAGDPRLEQLEGDLRDEDLVEQAVSGCDAVVHLACISNDPSFDLDPAMAKSVNYDAFLPLVRAAKRASVRRFVYASSSSVYGINEEPEVTEEMPLQPLTDYSLYKVLCEEQLLAERSPGFAALILRPATVCGYSPRLRLDLSVNILTNHAVNEGTIRVFGGEQLRPNIHIADTVDLYVLSLEAPEAQIDGRTFNAGWENRTILEIANTVREVVGEEVEIARTPTDDLRSYHISSELIRRELGFVPKRTIADAVRGLVDAFRAGLAPDPMTDSRYYNVKRMQELALR